MWMAGKGIKWNTVTNYVAENMMWMTGKVINLFNWETHICVGNLTIIGSDNGLSPGRWQAIIWTNAAILLIGSLGTNFPEISNIFILENAIESVVCEMAAILPRPQCVKWEQLPITLPNNSMRMAGKLTLAVSLNRMYRAFTNSLNGTYVAMVGLMAPPTRVWNTHQGPHY